MGVGAYLLLMAARRLLRARDRRRLGRVGQIVFFAGALSCSCCLVGLGACAGTRASSSASTSTATSTTTASSGCGSSARCHPPGCRCAAHRDPRDRADLLEPGRRAVHCSTKRGQRFVPAAAWPISSSRSTASTALPASDDLPRVSRAHAVDRRPARTAAHARTSTTTSRCRTGCGPIRSLRIVSPLLQLDRLVGFVLLYDPPPPFELTYEDRDLLKTVGRHVATHLAQHEADRRLAESRQFEAYNRLTAFMMHDLKNSVGAAAADRRRTPSVTSTTRSSSTTRSARSPTRSSA